MNVALTSDHGGFEQKEELAAYLADEGFDVLDYGPHDAESVDYPDFALKVGKAVADGTVERGILLCGTGIGMAIAANRIPGIRAANVTTEEFAVLSREHNDANVLTLSGRFVDLATNKALALAFLRTPFAGGRHERRIKKLDKSERESFDTYAC